MIGQRSEGTSEVIAALRSLATPDKLESWPERVFDPPQPEGGVRMLINDFGPSGASARMLALETPKRTFTLYECVDQPRALLIGASHRCDAVLWVRSAEHDTDIDNASSMLEAARFLGAERAIVFVTDAERVSLERRDLVERQARETLGLADFASDECAVVCSSGAIRAEEQRWRAAVTALRELLDEQVPYVDSDAHVALRIEDVFNIKGRGTVVTGQITAGTISVDDRLELLGRNGRRTITIRGIEMFRRIVKTATRPDYVGLLVDVGRDEVARGDLIVDSGAGVAARRAQIRGYCWAPIESWPPRERLRCLGVTEPASLRVLASSPSPLVVGPFEAQVEFDQPTALLGMQPMLLRLGEEPVFATAFFDRPID